MPTSLVGVCNYEFNQFTITHNVVQYNSVLIPYMKAVIAVNKRDFNAPTRSWKVSDVAITAISPKPRGCLKYLPRVTQDFSKTNRCEE